MEENRAELVFPFGGLNDAEALTDQPDATTTEAVNVRPYDPVTGRRRGAQRPGLKNYNASAIVADTRVQSLLPVSYEQNRLNYSMLSTPTQEWTAVTPSQGTASAMTVDKNGFIYAFDGTSSVVKYNPDGTKLNTLSMTASVPSTATTTIAVDEFGSVFASVSTGTASYVQKWKYTEDDAYLTSWSLDIAGVVRDMSIQNDLLYVAVDDGPYLAEGSRAQVQVYSGLQSDYTPPQIWNKIIASPVHGISVTGGGAIYYTCPPNPQRGEADGDLGDFAQSQVDWNPSDFTNIDERLHYWIDASYIQSQNLGVNHLDRLDNIDIPSIVTRSEYGSLDADDKTARYLLSTESDYRKFGSNIYRGYERPGPVFTANRFGELPSLVFDRAAIGEEALSLTDPVTEGCAMVSTHNKHNAAFEDAKASVTDSLQDNGAPFVGAEDAKYIFAMVGRIDHANTPERSVVFTINDKGNDGALFAMLANADQGADAAEEGSITVMVRGATYTADDESTTNNAAWRPYSTTSLGAQDAAGRFILTIVVDPSGTRKSAIRLNGRAVDSVTVTSSSTFKLEGRNTVEVQSQTSRSPMGRMILGGPSEGSTWALNDPVTADTGALADQCTVSNNADGSPVWYTGLDHSGFGGPSAGYNQEATLDATAGQLTNCEYFDGDICEILTVLADHDGGNINADSSTLVPYKSGTTHTSERDRTKCNSASGSTDVEKIEGYLAWKWGIASLLPSDDGGGTVDGLVSLHPFKSTPPSASGDTVVGFDNSDYTNAMFSKEGITAKLTPNGDGQWAVNGGGMGYGIVANDDNEVFTVGPVQADSTNPSTGTPEPLVQARKIVDQGATASTDPADGAWTYDRDHASDELSSEEIARYPALAVDDSDNLYWPLASTLKANHVRRLNGTTGALDWQYSISSQCQAFAVALPPTTPKYDDDTVTGPEFVYICSDNGEQDGTQDLTLPQLHKIRQVLAEQNIDDGVSARAVKLAAVVNGGIYEVTSTTAALATNGASALDGGSAFISGVSAFRKGYFTDGITYKQYDPKAGTVSDWAATKGEIPPRAKLVGFWRGRMVLARDPEDPQDWHMSALGDADDWDKNPAVLTATMAISGNNARCGKMPDAVNAIIPYSDDLLLFGCDSNIYRLTGDPMAGGQIDSVSTVTGVAFGEAWCKDPEGIIYFYGSRGGVYAMSPQGEIQSLTQARIERRLQDIDLERYRIKLVWNDREQGLHVYQCPFYFDGVVLRSWFWDKRNNAWYEDELASSTKQPSATCVMDGDSYDDRRMLIGCEDGVVRMYDNEIATDAGDRIDSKVLFGPMVVEHSSMQTRFCKLGVELASDQSGAEYDWYVSRAADVKGEPVRSGVLHSGPNGYPGGMFRGASSWVRLRNGAASQRWALEAMSLSAYPAGRKRL